MPTLTDKILRRIRAHGRSQWVFTPTDFLDLGNRAAVDRAISRLVRNQTIRRIGHGLYDFPRMSEILNRPAPPDINRAVQAIAKRDNIKIMPDGLVAANQLGLTNAVPAQNAYITNGDSRKIAIGGQTVRLQHRSEKIMQWSDRPGATVVQAVLWLGKPIARDPEIVEILKTKLTDEVKADLLAGANELPSWMANTIVAVCTGAIGDN
jgi:Family of unknown function (DUF6088)